MARAQSSVVSASDKKAFVIELKAQIKASDKVIRDLNQRVLETEKRRKSDDKALVKSRADDDNECAKEAAEALKTLVVLKAKLEEFV
jgi:hypothetical protein